MTSYMTSYVPSYMTSLNSTVVYISHMIFLGEIVFNHLERESKTSSKTEQKRANNNLVKYSLKKFTQYRLV